MTEGQTTFSPGDINAFAKYISEVVTPEITGLKDTATRLMDEVDLGEYDLSKDAQERYRTAATSQRDFITHLGQRVDQLVTGTQDLARRYTDLENLNATGADTVRASVGPEGA
ncbi:MAG: hypothetical protein Q4G45_08315 [Actinomycetia bacterium]|nr:hypothetical protein [Actinomycetes bacterium]